MSDHEVPHSGVKGLHRRWIHGAGILVLVFVNGLILTAASYAILNIFVSQIVSDAVQGTREDVTRMMTSQMRGAQTAFEALSLSFSLSEDPRSLRQGTLTEDVADWVPFEGLAWLPQGDFHDPVLISLKGNSSAQGAFLSPEVLARIEKDLKKYSSPFPQKEGDVRVLALEFDAPHSPPEYIRDRTLVFVRSIDSQTGARGVLVGALPAHLLLDPNWFTLHPNVSVRSLSFSDRVVLVGARDLLTNSSGLHTILIAIGQDLRAEFVVSDNTQTVMLRNVPFLMLFLGFLLTVVGTLYVRTNQKQAVKMTAMNRTLALKNMELNNQVMERERLNQALRKTERENRAIIDSVSDIIFEADTSGTLLFVNEAWRKITGFEPDRAHGRNFFDMMPPQDQDQQRRDFYLLVKGQKAAFRSFARLRTEDGTFRTVEIGYSMLRLDETKNLRVVGTVTDVEERRRAEAALGEAERKYRSIWENVASGIYQMTPEGQLLTANPALARIFGYDTPAEMLKDIHNANRQLYASLKDRQAMIRDLMLEGQVRNIEIEGIRRDKNSIWISESSRLVKDEEGNILYFEGSMDDVTQRKEAESKLREAMLTSDLANRSKTEFLANMSHELRTPLNAIIGFSEIIRDEVFGPLGQRQYWDYARDIHESGRHLLSIINTILEVARVDAGDRQLNEGLVDVRLLVDGVVALLKPKSELAELSVSIVVPDSLPPLVCEELAVKQMLINLMSNAIKFTPEGGSVAIAAEQDKNGEMRLAVTDTGVGLSEEEIERVMAPFGHADGSFARSTSGAGLGLTLVNSLVRLHGGRLEMFSQKGIGTTAAIIFPAHRVGDRPASQMAAQIVQNTNAAAHKESSET